MKNQIYLLLIFSLFINTLSLAQDNTEFIAANEQYNLENYDTVI